MLWRKRQASTDIARRILKGRRLLDAMRCDFQCVCRVRRGSCREVFQLRIAVRYVRSRVGPLALGEGQFFVHARLERC